jgi:hypothetical protein
MAEPMEQPGPVLAVISVVALAAIGGALYVSWVAATEPPQPPGVVNASPAAQQPAKDAEGNPLPVQPGEPEENQPVVNAPPAGSGAQAPAQPAPGDGG